MHRVVEPEILDDLPFGDLQAIGSRVDLRLVNCLMGNAAILSRTLRPQLAPAPKGSQTLRVVELGAGDGTLLLRLARRWSAMGVKAEVTLLDPKILFPKKRDATLPVSTGRFKSCRPTFSTGWSNRLHPST